MPTGLRLYHPCGRDRLIRTPFVDRGQCSAKLSRVVVFWHDATLWLAQRQNARVAGRNGCSTFDIFDHYGHCGVPWACCDGFAPLDLIGVHDPAMPPGAGGWEWRAVECQYLVGFVQFSRYILAAKKQPLHPVSFNHCSAEADEVMYGGQGTGGDANRSRSQILPH